MKYEGSGAWQKGGAASKPDLRSFTPHMGIAAVYEASFQRRERRSATKSLARLCVANACAVCLYGKHSTQCSLGYGSIELTVFYSVNIGDVTNELHEVGSPNVATECEDQRFTSNYAEQRAVERGAIRLLFCE